MNDSVRDTVLEAIEISLEAQLQAVRRLRKQVTSESKQRAVKGTSQMDMVQDVLLDAGEPLHIKEILSRIEVRFGKKLDPDSLGSALTKRVVKSDRFRRVQKNTFALIEEAGDAG